MYWEKLKQLMVTRFIIRYLYYRCERHSMFTFMYTGWKKKHRFLKSYKGKGRLSVSPRYMIFVGNWSVLGA